MSPIWKVSSILLLLFLIACGGEQEQEKSEFNGTVPDEQGDSITIISTNMDVVDFELTAVHIEKFNKTKLTLADTVHVTSYNPDGSVKSKLYCDKAELDEAKNIFTGIGNVKLESDNGIMKTPYIIWYRDSDEILAKQGVTMIRGENILRGEEMKTNSYLDSVKIIKLSAEGKVNEEGIDW